MSQWKGTNLTLDIGDVAIGESVAAVLNEVDELSGPILTAAGDLRPKIDATDAELKELRARMRELCVQYAPLWLTMADTFDYTKGPKPPALKTFEESFYARGLSSSAAQKEVQRVRDKRDPARVTERERRAAERQAEKVVQASDRPTLPNFKADDVRACASVLVNACAAMLPRTESLVRDARADAGVLVSTLRELATAVAAQIRAVESAESKLPEAASAESIAV